ncbi:DUF296 domain-containing protein [Candidatus Uhrbacteria bacterium]|nr:DUF296 domain-containing protein [Candidatus Uhrbacteria bacterium]MBD3284317.1 DUF296 domain-containing protein [Candidatus Uhrbacteria bacterium]
MKQISFRLKPGDLLREEIERRASENDIKAGVLLSIVGGLKHAELRMAGSEPDAQSFMSFEGPFEIVSGTGTISKNGCHLHVSISDREGNVFGGHLRKGCAVAYTAEIVIGIFDDVVYTREMDEETGFKELNITDR